MGKIKTFFKIVGIIVIILIVLVGIGTVYIYQKNKWILNAEDLSGISFASEIFNDKLVTCNPSFSYKGSYLNEPWEIQGLKSEKCVVVFHEFSMDTTEEDVMEGYVRETVHKCRLPYEIYSNPEDIDWKFIFNSEYC